MRVCLIGFLRSEQRFQSLDDLLETIQKDISQTRIYCNDPDNENRGNTEFESKLSSAKVNAMKFLAYSFDSLDQYSDVAKIPAYGGNDNETAYFGFTKLDNASNK